MTTPTNLKSGEMYPKDLRIGNKVSTPFGIETVIDVLCDSVNTDVSTRLYDELSGIPLTEDILVKCGFESRFDVNFGKLSIAIHGVHTICMTDVGGVYLGTIKTNIKYLHQLQNLYFALTGQELEVKL